MKQQLPLLLAIYILLCSSFAAVANTVPGNISLPSGLAVWGNTLHIHTTDTLRLSGDLFLFTTRIQGSGTLLLLDTTSRRIVAIESSLPHLIVDNADTVTLQGDLNLHYGLTLVRGVFDTHKGRLDLADSACLQVFPGSQWLQEDAEVSYWLPLLPLLPPSVQQGGAAAEIPPCNDILRSRLWQQLAVGTPFFTTARPTEVWMRTPHPPPEASAGECAAA